MHALPLDPSMQPRPPSPHPHPPRRAKPPSYFYCSQCVLWAYPVTPHTPQVGLLAALLGELASAAAAARAVGPGAADAAKAAEEFGDALRKLLPQLRCALHCDSVHRARAPLRLRLLPSVRVCVHAAL